MIDIVNVYKCIDCDEFVEKWELENGRCRQCALQHDWREVYGVIVAERDALRQQLAEAQAELATLRAQADPDAPGEVVGLDFPDGPGAWVFRGSYRCPDYGEEGQVRKLWAVYWYGAVLHFYTERGIPHPITDAVGQWFRPVMPTRTEKA